MERRDFTNWRVRWRAALGALTAVVLAVTLDAQGWRELSFTEPGPGGGIVRIDRASIVVDDMTILTLIANAYQVRPNRIVGPPSLGEHYKVTAIADTNDGERFRAMLRKALDQRFRLKVRREKRNSDVMLLRRANGPQKLRREPSDERRLVVAGRDRLSGAADLPHLARILERYFDAFIEDATGLKGIYVVDMTWERDDLESLNRALRDRLGLRVTGETRKVEMLIVERDERPRP